MFDGVVLNREDVVAQVLQSHVQQEAGGGIEADMAVDIPGRVFEASHVGQEGQVVVQVIEGVDDRVAPDKRWGDGFEQVLAEVETAGAVRTAEPLPPRGGQGADVPGLYINLAESERLSAVHKEEGSGFAAGLADDLKVEAVP